MIIIQLRPANILRLKEKKADVLMKDSFRKMTEK